MSKPTPEQWAKIKADNEKHRERENTRKKTRADQMVMMARVHLIKALGDDLLTAQEIREVPIGDGPKGEALRMLIDEGIVEKTEDGYRRKAVTL